MEAPQSKQKQNIIPFVYYYCYYKFPPRNKKLKLVTPEILKRRKRRQQTFVNNNNNKKQSKTRKNGQTVNFESVKAATHCFQIPGIDYG